MLLERRSCFFYSLVVKKTLKSVPVNAKINIETIEKELINITGGELDGLQNDVEQHERFLSYLLERKYLNEESYRNKYQQRILKFNLFEKHFKYLKREIFYFG